MIEYAFKSFLISALLYCFYHLWLRNKPFHRYNRVFLLSIIPASLLVPMLHIPVRGTFISRLQSPGANALLRVIPAPFREADPVQVSTHNLSYTSLSFAYIGIILYALVATILLIMIIRSVIYVKRIGKKYHREKINNIWLYNTTEREAPFSWLNSIFWRSSIEIDSEAGRYIFNHELFHVREKHTLDRLFLGVVSAVWWFNPFVHLLKKELWAIHEFQADEYASRENTLVYAETLMMVSIQQENQLPIVQQFFNNNLKRRITMLTTKSAQKMTGSWLRRYAIISLCVLLCASFAFSPSKARMRNTNSNREITLVVDPGHAANFPGFPSAITKLTEADFNLAIAKKIQAIGSRYNVRVLLTRSGSQTDGAAKTVREDLLYRSNFVKQNHADLLISVHANASGNPVDTASGIELWISGRRTNDDKSALFGKSLINELGKSYVTNPSVKKAETGVLIMDNATVPAVTVEFGYLNNKNDIEFFTNEKNQEKIAENVLTAVQQFVSEAK